jgi:hypothetical protein
MFHNTKAVCCMWLRRRRRERREEGEEGGEGGG